MDDFEQVCGATSGISSDNVPIVFLRDEMILLAVRAGGSGCTSKLLTSDLSDRADQAIFTLLLTLLKMSVISGTKFSNG